MADDIGQVIHFEVTGKDQKALQSYYSDLFGWKLNTDFPGGYGMTDHSQTGIVVGVVQLLVRRKANQFKVRGKAVAQSA